ncbi:hypothetical protein V5O48_003585 [Marasmius crinis-equi]|uniref:ABC1 atypical kinase-like domain-containing protein n=1 Tax=Marasmius crinis-equi TaxID=585013 RepID=A0ABR3FSI8_9AGAR
MPPGPAYNWLCVISSVADIASHAARYRAAQLGKRSVEVALRRRAEGLAKAGNPGPVSVERTGEGKPGVEKTEVPDIASRGTRLDTAQWGKTGIEDLAGLNKYEEPRVSSPEADIEVRLDESSPAIETKETPPGILKNDTQYVEKEEIPPAPVQQNRPDIPAPSIFTAPIAQAEETAIGTAPDMAPAQVEAVVHTRNLQSSKVPSSRIGRLFHYGGLAASLGYGAASELLRRSSSQEENAGSVMMTEANIKRLVSKLSQMRGAALKLGQFLSIQDTHLLPPELDKVFRRVQDSAHYMPDWQMERVLVDSLGPEWTRHFVSFDRIPFAAASIGQVHSAVLTAEASPTGKPAPVAVKIQFPNISASISSDIGYIKMLLTAGRLLPKGLFLDRTVQVMKQELAEECDYKREGSFLKTFSSPEFLGNDPRYKVPWAWDGSTERVLVMERVDGVSVGEAEILGLSQEHRNEIASNIILLCLKELFEFRMMQTDPNYTNFLYNMHTRQIELVDFGATRVYSKEFMDGWLRLLKAAAEDPEDREACIKESLGLGYLTGQENEVMLDAHVNSMTLLATPFKGSTRQPYAFGPGTEWEGITRRIRDQIPVMLQHRLTPPPKETYSLNRKLSGAFLLASRLRAVVDTKAIWESVVQKYRFD